MADESSSEFESSLTPYNPSIKKEGKKGFFERIRSFLPLQNKIQEDHAGERRLAGRIHAQLYNSAHSIVQQLHSLKKELRKKLIENEEEDLLASVEAVIEPLLREYQQIEAKLQINPDTDLVDNKTTLK